MSTATHAPTPGPDFRVENHGSIFLLVPFTPEANEWVADNLPDELMMMGLAIVVEHRYIADIVEGILHDGLEVK